MIPARLAAALGGTLPPAGARIGLLGGSFNPAHEGHRHISLEALRRLDLDQVWWLVSPQNPLKSATGMAPQAERIAAAAALARHPRIRVTGLESLLGTRFTADTLAHLVRRFPRVRFVWLMGADNLAQISAWQGWPQIFNAVVIAVFDRPAYSLGVGSAKAALRFAGERVRESKAKTLASLTPPAWTFIHARLIDKSATQIRARRGQSSNDGPEERHIARH